MNPIERWVLLIAALSLIVLAALSGVWMKPYKKKESAGPPSIVVIVPPVREPTEAPDEIPGAKRYPL
jgi:hypothetical protein